MGWARIPASVYVLMMPLLPCSWAIDEGSALARLGRPVRIRRWYDCRLQGSRSVFLVDAVEKRRILMPGQMPQIMTPVGCLTLAAVRPDQPTRARRAATGC